jgi:hypothetical protein
MSLYEHLAVDVGADDAIAPGPRTLCHVMPPEAKTRTWSSLVVLVGLATFVVSRVVSDERGREAPRRGGEVAIGLVWAAVAWVLVEAGRRHGTLEYSERRQRAAHLRADRHDLDHEQHDAGEREVLQTSWLSGMPVSEQDPPRLVDLPMPSYPGACAPELKNRLSAEALAVKFTANPLTTPRDRT